MNAEFLKFAVSVVAAAMSAYSAIRSDLVEQKIRIEYHTKQIDTIERKLEK